MARASKQQSAPGEPPGADALHEAALVYLGRYAATEAGLLRVLERRIDRWARAARDAGGDGDAIAVQERAAVEAARAVVARLAKVGAVSDVTFAENKARSLARSGRSRRAIGAQLAAKGVGAETLRRVLSEADADAELVAALVLARRRRIGPFRSGDPPDLAGQRRELAALARAGFSQDVARRALAMEAAEAEELVTQFRRSV